MSQDPKTHGLFQKKQGNQKASTQNSTNDFGRSDLKERGSFPFFCTWRWHGSLSCVDFGLSFKALFTCPISRVVVTDPFKYIFGNDLTSWKWMSRARGKGQFIGVSEGNIRPICFNSKIGQIRAAAENRERSKRSKSEMQLPYIFPFVLYGHGFRTKK